MSEVKILDIGGTAQFWNYIKDEFGIELNLTLLNISEDATLGYKSIIMDANDLSEVKSNQYDIIFSNSMIEHIGNLELQQNFAKEVQRIGKYVFIQTPAFIFPLEPHFLFPFFHWLPLNIRIHLLQNFELGWYKKEKDINKARMIVESIRILKKGELKSFFPSKKIHTERLFIFSKSYLTYG